MRCPFNLTRERLSTGMAAAFATAFLASAPNPAESACAPFVALGEDASFLLLDGDSLAVLRVGSHWTSGVRQVSRVLPGSSDRLPAFATNEFVSIFDRSPMIAGPPPEDGGPNAIVAPRMRSGAFASRTEEPSTFRPAEYIWPPYYYTPVGADVARHDQWVHWLRAGSLFRLVDVGGANAVYHVSAPPDIFTPTQINRDSFGRPLPRAANEPAAEPEPETGQMEVLTIWDVGDMDLSSPFCAADDSLYFTNSAFALRVPATGGGAGERRPLEGLTESGYQLTQLHTKNCKALANRPSADDPSQLEYALYDIATDTIEAEFASPAPARNILFSEGTRWLQQLAEVSAESGPTQPNGDSAASSGNDATSEQDEIAPSNTFRLIDTATGEVLREAELDIPGGALIEEIQCDAATPRAVIGGPRRIWLLDAETLAILAENEIPFERDYFVFE